MNFSQVVLELPNTVAGHRFFVAEHSGIDSVAAAQECEKAPKEGVFFGENWLAMAVPCAQLSVIGARVGLSRIVVRWAKGQEPRQEDIPAIEAQLQEILRSTGEHAKSLPAEFLGSRLVVELPANMLQLADSAPKVNINRRSKLPRVLTIALLVALSSLLAIPILFAISKAQQTNSPHPQNSGMPGAGNKQAKETTVSSGQPHPTMHPDADISVSIPTQYVPVDSRSELQRSLEFFRTEKAKFDKKYSPDTTASTSEDRKLAVIPDAFSANNVKTQINSFKHELSQDEQCVADFAAFTFNVLEVCNFNLKGLSKLETSQEFIDQIDKESAYVLDVIDLIKSCQSDMQIKQVVFMEQLKKHQVNLAEVADHAAAFQSLIKTANETRPTVVFKLSKLASETWVGKLGCEQLSIKEASGREMASIRFPKKLRPGESLEMELSTTNRTLWCKPEVKLVLANIRVTKSPEMNLEAHLITSAVDLLFLEPQYRTLELKPGPQKITIVPDQLELTAEVKNLTKLTLPVGN